tara:strand:+ start:33283 stop:33813 length:531 start_codon:yes stop_codon:yes gene_type:complete
MKEPWEIPNSPWKDEKAYLNWLRGSIRRIWSRHPVKIAYKQSRRYKAPVGKNGKDVWVSDCEVCGKQSRDCQVDHLHGGYGFTDWESFTEWARMILWVGFDDVQEVCVECHEVINLSQRKGLTFQEAYVEKTAIAICKQKLDKQWLLDHNITPASTAAKRREQIVNKLREEHNERL